jgi:glutamine---fructose-6-phosphate transaminase (isomerizing)
MPGTGTSTKGESTRQEILSQPAVWASVVDDFRRVLPPTPELQEASEVVFTGCGSTHYLSLWAARHCQQRLGVRAIGVPASELLLHPYAWIRPDSTPVLVAVSRSGETTETCLAVETFRALVPGQVVVVTCYPDSALAKLADVVVPTTAAQERSVVQTRSFTAMMLGVARLLEGSPPEQLGAQLAAACERLLADHQEAITELAQDEGIRHGVFLGQGPCYGLACEAMLKAKETALLPSEAYHSLEVRHGPMAMVGPSSLVATLLRADTTRERAVVDDMTQLGAHTLTLAPGPSDEHVIGLPPLPEVWADVLYLPLLQLLACDMSLHHGLDPDRPTNLDAVVQLGGEP